MDYFYLPDIDYSKTFCSLPKEESKHIVRVLRKKEGDHLLLVNGLGCIAEAVILGTDYRCCKVEIIRVNKQYGKRPYKMRLCVAPTKNIARYEWFIEKATEIGVDEIIPLITFHSERRKLNDERLQKILIAAMKQSQKAYLPILHKPISFESFLKMPSFDGFKYIAHCENKFERERFFENYEKNANVDLLIGPEGDFSEKEIKLATDYGYKGIYLGASRLRTETAAIVACSSIYQINS